MRTFQKEIMNQRSKITICTIALLAVVSLKALGADAPTFGAVQTAKDAQNNPSGLAKGEGVVKDGPVTPAPGQNQVTKVGDAAPPVAIASPQAPSQPPAWAGPTFADLEKLRSENAMLAEQLKNAELKNKITAQGGSSSFSGSGVAGQAGGSSNKAPSGPRVVMIAGGESNYRANILLSNGQSITASLGTSVPGFGVVSAITPDAVQFGVGKAKRFLPLITNGANADFVMAP